MTAKPARLSDLLHANAPHGAPVELLLDSWAEVEDALRADGTHAREALNAASDALPAVAGAISDRRALATAVLTARGAVCHADPAYLQLFPDSADLRPLLRRALHEGPVVTLAEGASGAAFTAWIGDAQAAARWPLGRDVAEALSAGPERLAVIVSAPSRSSELARQAARALDLTALEARLAAALLFAPNLEVAAAEAGVGRETARDALRRINAKLGVRRTPELISRLIGVMCVTQDTAQSDEEVATSALGLTPAEARAAALTARGATAPEAARALGVSPETVKTHMKAALAKTGAKGVKDLARLLAEARGLVTLAEAAEPVLGEEEGGGRLRVLPALDGARRIALIDYGPYDAEPLIVFHGAAAGRRLPERLRAALVARGLRPIVIQRPGFGLTDPADGDHLAAAAADMEAVAERLRLKSFHLLARDTGVPAALEFARTRPHRLGRVVLMNPPTPASMGPPRAAFMVSVQRHLLHNPNLVIAFAEFLRRQATSQLIERVLLRSLSELPTDRAAIQDPAVRDFLVRDIQALCARSVSGFAAEHAIYANGWRPSPGLTGDGWILAVSEQLASQHHTHWLPFPGLRRVELEGAGMLVQFTHPEAIAALFD